MSKKKASTKSTMTLKDFHGGSIPTDLPLPSAPGVVPRSLDRGPFAGVGGFGRQDSHRARPNSAGGPRGLEDGVPFLTRIGRNFDEDERKPFHPSSAGEEARPQPFHLPSKMVSSSQLQASTSLNSAVSAWGAKKEEPVVPAPPAITGAASKFAQASAIEKVASGRWQSKLVSFNRDTELVASDGGSELDDELRPLSAEGGLAKGLVTGRITGDRDDLAQVHRSLVESVSEITLGGNLPIERPRLNLLPRSQQLRQPDDTSEKKREKVFGGARPREVVLKERGVDESSLTPFEQSPLPLNREEPRADGRKEQHVEPEMVEQQRSSRRRSCVTGPREVEKPAPSRSEASSWRRVEDPPQPKPTEPSTMLRFGKAASAVELAQAFAKPKSGSSSGSGPVPFSRLAVTPQSEIYSGAPHRRINGY